jgi:hypothetical protein
MLINIIRILFVLFLLGCLPGKFSTSRPVEFSNSPTPIFSTPTHTAIFLDTPTTTPETLITATIWLKNPEVPILIYHRFASNNAANSTNDKVRFSDFSQELEDLYASGYTLVSFEKWIAGDLVVPPGRHPLILSMDDLFFNNQIALLDDGTPSTDTGIGILWKFYQEHPAFGFHVALFTTLGDKLYANPDDPNWQVKLARTIVWCIEHDAMPYNHTYQHRSFEQSTPIEIRNDLLQNDKYLRELLELVGRTDLIQRLSNYLSLPYGEWPTTQAGLDAIYNYSNPEGMPIQGVFEASFDTTRLMQPPFSSDFSRWHIPRFTATLNSIHTLVQESNQMPTVTTCEFDSGNGNPIYLGNQIDLLIRTDRCQKGIYVTDKYIFDATKPGIVSLIFTRTELPGH